LNLVDPVHLLHLTCSLNFYEPVNETKHLFKVSEAEKHWFDCLRHFSRTDWKKLFHLLTKLSGNRIINVHYSTLNNSSPWLDLWEYAKTKKPDRLLPVK